MSDDIPKVIRRSGELRRAEAVAIALDLIAERGPEGVTTSEIARRMGLVQAALFKHFPNKDAIWDAATDAIAERIGARMRAILSRPGPPVEKIVAVIVGYVEIATDIPAIPVLLRHQAGADGAGRLSARVAERFDRLRQLVGGLVAAAAQGGAFSPAADPRLVAELCIACVQASMLPGQGDPTGRPVAVGRQVAALLRLAGATPAPG